MRPNYRSATARGAKGLAFVEAAVCSSASMLLEPGRVPGDLMCRPGSSAMLTVALQEFGMTVTSRFLLGRPQCFWYLKTLKDVWSSDFLLPDASVG